MNLILFDSPFEKMRLEGSDHRSKHIFEVLRARVGTKVFVGFVNGLRARAEVTRHGVFFTVLWRQRRGFVAQVFDALG